MSAVDLDRIAHCLKRMERKAYRKEECKPRQVQIAGEEVIVFENAKESDVDNEAADEYRPLVRFAFLQQDTRKIIHRDGKEKDQNIDGYECHIKIAGGEKQERYTGSRGQQKIS